MTTRTRTDAHRPAAIVPADYDFVAYAYIKCEDLGDAMLLKAHREALAAHMARTGGDYSDHDHGGSCYVCGAHAMYLCVFHHRPSNTYVKTGFECADKMEYDSGAGEAFRKSIRDAREAQAGKRKAQATLSDAGLSAAWEIFTKPAPSIAAAQNGYARDRDEMTICDIVGKLVQYGSISDKALSFLRSLCERVANRPAIEAARAAEKEAAKPLPSFEGRVTIIGEVVGFYSTDWGSNMVVKHADGWTVAGTRPSGLTDVNKGDRVQFDATIKPHRTDSKRGFWSRPTKAKKIA